MDKTKFDSWTRGRSVFKIIENVEELEAALRQLHEQRSGFVYIEIPSYRNALTIDVDVYYGCIMFGDKSSDPPYYMVLGDPDAPDEDFEFDVGGTPTPISLRYCIPFEKVISLVKHFYLYGRFPEGTEWEEV